MCGGHVANVVSRVCRIVVKRERSCGGKVSGGAEMLLEDGG